MMSWLNTNSRCLTFLGGVPKLLIPDELKSAVKKTGCYEPVINDSYPALAERHGTVIIPTRPYKPKDKPIPHELVGQQLSLKAGQQVVQVWHKEQCMTQHPRSLHEYKHTTTPLHLPARHRGHGTWTPESLIEMRRCIGSSTGRVVDAMLKGKAHQEQAYRAVLVLKALYYLNIREVCFINCVDVNTVAIDRDHRSLIFFPFIKNSVHRGKVFYLRNSGNQ